ncbi:MAG: hypothetical protein Aurels2KO_47710 [Aureliella sp.]
MAENAYAGQRRRKQTPWSVKFGDALVSRIIAVGGIGTIVAILLVVLVLVGTAFPLLSGPQFDPWQELRVSDYDAVGVDADGVLMWGIDSQGYIEVRETLSSKVLASHPLESDVEVTASFVSIDRKTIALGFSDGTFRSAKIDFEDSLLAITDLPDGVSVSEQSPVATDGDSVWQWFNATSVRHTRLADVEWSDPVQVGDSPVLALDFLPDSSSNRFARSSTERAVAVCGEEFVFCTITKSRRLGRVKSSLEKLSCPITKRSTDGKPLEVMLLNNAGQAVVVWPNGTLDRIAIGDEKVELVESQSAVLGDVELKCTAPLLARQTILCGTSDGVLQGWSIVREQADTSDTSSTTTNSDGLVLALAHEVQVSSEGVQAVVSSAQSHVAAAVDGEGEVSLVYVTNDTLLGKQSTGLASPVRNLAVGPDGDILIAATADTVKMSAFDVGHPEASVKGYFGKVWYEAHDEPKYIWQSSAATEEAEIKLSLMPLVFGTMKATLYAMLISVPLAIFAAIYTSEFLSAKMRTRIKPLVEMMASLPSVVLGYVAALVVAPHLEAHLMTVLLSLLLVPTTLVLAGHLWSMLPVRLLVSLQFMRLALMFVCIPISFCLAAALSPLVESFLFGGSLVEWLGGQGDSPLGGWMLLLVPSCALAVTFLVSGPLSIWVRGYAARSTPRQFALFSIGRFFATILIVVGAAYLASAAFSGAGLDLRGAVFDTYQDKNALLVGFALGFCVIPIIYTIADDALQAVPRQLRSASLGCGATPWQTTVRVVVPSAMSGLFSAVMIGLGRAVGETMVVLCAAGNTPLMEWNVFNGFKTLSAALATELPEAAKGSTHFRTLFLAALLLFFLTLIANTLAEFVRIRFRKRASQL